MIMRRTPRQDRLTHLLPEPEAGGDVTWKLDACHQARMYGLVHHAGKGVVGRREHAGKDGGDGRGDYRVLARIRRTGRVRNHRVEARVHLAWPPPVVDVLPVPGGD